MLKYSACSAPVQLVGVLRVVLSKISVGLQVGTLGRVQKEMTQRQVTQPDHVMSLWAHRFGASASRPSVPLQPPNKLTDYKPVY